MSVTPETVRAAQDAATPGPWWFDNNEGYGANAIHARHMSDTRAYESVAHAIGDSAEAEANARLIAMAPDLATAYLAQAEEIERLRKRVEAADRLAAMVRKLDRRKPGEDGGRLVLEIDILLALAAEAAYRATEERE